MICTQCNQYKICRVHEFMKQFHGEIVFDISQCKYIKITQQTVNNIHIRDAKEINDRSEQIHALSQKRHDIPKPQSNFGIMTVDN